jgi:hypothetical protein
MQTVIASIKKYPGAGALMGYLLSNGKEAQIIGSSIFLPAINKAIDTEDVIEKGDFKLALLKESIDSFNLLANLNTKVSDTTMHLNLGFDPIDGHLSNEFKAQIAEELLDRMGFSDTYWIVVAHGRDDPGHAWAHNHDHIHIVASRVDSRGNRIPQEWDYPRCEAILRDMEVQHQLNLFVPLWQRQVEEQRYWLIQQEEELAVDEKLGTKKITTMTR